MSRIDIVKTEVFKFDELSDDARQTAIEKLFDINVDMEWWDGVYDDAERVGIKIESFDFNRFEIDGSVYDFEETAEKILVNHGKKCETYQTATNYIHDRAALIKKHSDGVNTDYINLDNEYDFDLDIDELDEEFKKAILEDYRIILQKDYEYLSSEEAIIETLEANDYEFTVDGVLY